MRTIITIIAILFGATYANGQTSNDGTKGAETLLFDHEVWNMGRIEEAEGVVAHTFEYTNYFDHPISIERVYTSCGCTTTNYSRKAVKAGERGEFTVEFDPEGREGRVDKKVTIVYNNGQGRTTLRIKGKVIGRPRSVADLYPQDLGAGVRADVSYKAFGNLAQGTTRSMTIALINSADQTRSIDYVWLEASGLLEVNMPTELAPQEVALATLTYSLPEESDHYGLLRDRLGVLIDGERSKREVVATAIGIDNFEKGTTDGTRAKANIEPVYHDFGNAQRGTLLETEIGISNGGSAPLIIRSVVPREGTTIELEQGTTIETGERIAVGLSYRVPIEGYDTVFGGAMIVVNDPLRPVRELRVAANVVGIASAGTATPSNTAANSEGAVGSDAYNNSEGASRSDASNNSGDVGQSSEGSDQSSEAEQNE